MLPFRNLTSQIQQSYRERRFLYLASLMVFFWSLFDGVISYVTPLVITEKGFSKTAMGLIYATSSIAGAIFDFLLSKYLKNTHWRKLFLIMFVICFGYPLLLGKANGVLIFLLAMALWGLYYDLINFGLFDFLSRKSKPEEHVTHFGFVWIFHSLGYLIAPLLTGLLIGGLVGTIPLWFAFFFLLIAFGYYCFLIHFTRKERPNPNEVKINRKVNLLVELHLWSKIGKTLLPVLLFTLLIYLFDAFFWAIGPFLGGLFMVMYTLPVLLTGWLVGPVTKKFGKKKSAFYSFFVSSLLLMVLPVAKNPVFILGIVFLSSMIGSLAWPAIKGAFVDYITEAYKYEKEIEGLNDFFTNGGYIIGPILAGLLADKLGNSGAFAVLGVVGAISSVILIITTPKKIKVVVKS